MVDYKQIGKRICEERKYILKLSQEKMAEDLGLYQADISNLENAKKGSGIADLERLDLIANYLGISLESLLFGGMRDMEPYHGEKIQLKRGSGKIRKEHRTALARLMGRELSAKTAMQSHICGSYTIYYAWEYLGTLKRNEQTGEIEPDETVPRIHVYVFYKSEITAVMSAFITSVMEHVYRPRFLQLQSLIPMEIFDITETMKVLNPYVQLFENAETEEEKNRYRSKLFERMDALRRAGEKRCIAYLESVYVRADARQNGIMRMCMDFMKKLFPGCIMWLNLLPASDESLDYETAPINPIYDVADVGQLNINAAIAERLGFVISPTLFTIRTKTIGPDGVAHIEAANERGEAYFLPQEIRAIVNAEECETENCEAENIENEL